MNRNREYRKVVQTCPVHTPYKISALCHDSSSVYLLHGIRHKHREGVPLAQGLPYLLLNELVVRKPHLQRLRNIRYESFSRVVHQGCERILLRDMQAAQYRVLSY